MNQAEVSGDWTNVSNVSDETLVLRSQLGDRDALNQLVHRWHSPLWNLLHHITLDTSAADDLAQETWLSAVRSLAGLRQTDRFRWWLFSIARRRATDRLRHHYRQPEVVSDLDNADAIETAQPGDPPMMETPDLLVADHVDLIRLLTPLDYQLREVLVLHYLNDWPIDEIATSLDLPPGTVKSRLHRARARLNQTIATPLTAKDEGSK